MVAVPATPWSRLAPKGRPSPRSPLGVGAPLPRSPFPSVARGLRRPDRRRALRVPPVRRAAPRRAAVVKHRGRFRAASAPLRWCPNAPRPRCPLAFVPPCSGPLVPRSLVATRPRCPLPRVAYAGSARSGNQKDKVNIEQCPLATMPRSPNAPTHPCPSALGLRGSGGRALSGTGARGLRCPGALWHRSPQVLDFSSLFPCGFTRNEVTGREDTKVLCMRTGSQHNIR